MLSVSNLTVSFGPPDERIPIVRGVDFEIGSGKILGIVGESGSGKSVTCLALMQLLDHTAAIDGTAMFDGLDLLSLSPTEIVKARGATIAMIFQDPAAALNPVRSIGWQLYEAIRLTRAVREQRPAAPQSLRDEAIQLLRDVGMPDPERRLNEYPHQLSGGMNQRALIAIMLAREPKLLIADEPTTALDVTIQAQILGLLLELRKRRNMTIVLISHDLGVIAETCDEVAVMYCGRVVEICSAEDLFFRPQHPYTVGLLNSRPRIDREISELRPIDEVVPSPSDLPPGCAFAPRCTQAIAACHQATPPLEGRTPSHRYACFNPAGEQS